MQFASNYTSCDTRFMENAVSKQAVSERVSSTRLVVKRATDLLSPADAEKFRTLQAEYCKLSTSAKRMSEIYAELVVLRETVSN
jgi:hypothetical protein